MSRVLHYFVAAAFLMVIAAFPLTNAQAAKGGDAAAECAKIEDPTKKDECVKAAKASAEKAKKKVKKSSSKKKDSKKKAGDMEKKNK